MATTSAVEGCVGNGLLGAGLGGSLGLWDGGGLGGSLGLWDAGLGGSLGLLDGGGLGGSLGLWVAGLGGSLGLLDGGAAPFPPGPPTVDDVSERSDRRRWRRPAAGWQDEGGQGPADGNGDRRRTYNPVAIPPLNEIACDVDLSCGLGWVGKLNLRCGAVIGLRCAAFSPP